MKFSISKEKLINIFTELSNVVKENTVRPYLSGVLITINHNLVTFKCTCVDMDLIIKEECINCENGEVLVRPNIILEYIKLVDEDFINIEKRDGYLIVNNAEFSIMNEESFPEIIENLALTICKKNSSELIDMFEKVKFVSATDSTHQVLNSIKLVFNEDNTELIATDSYRLIYFIHKSKNIVKEEVIIPIESVNAICKLIKNFDGEVLIGVCDSNLVLNWGNSYFNSKLINNEYPNFRNIMENYQFEMEAEANKNNLKSALKRVISVTKNSDDSKYSAIFNFNQKNLSISGFSGGAKTNQNIDIIKSGEDLRISMNCKIILDFLEKINGNMIIRGSGPKSMLKLTEINKDDYIYFFMPINTGNK